MKNKTTAGLLAILGGWLGLHRFYLGQPLLGILYIAFSWTMFPFIISLIDGIAILSSSDKDFDRKYNRRARRNYESRNAPRRRQDEQANYQKKTSSRKAPKKQEYRPLRKNPFVETAMKKYEEFDMKAAIDDFQQALNIDPRNTKAHFFLACAYSLTEDAEKGFYHLSKAVEYGMKNTEKIKTQDELAFLRIQDKFEVFEKAGFKLSPELENVQQASTMDEDLLLHQLNKLRELRERGLLTEEEFIQEKRKLKA